MYQRFRVVIFHTLSSPLQGSVCFFRLLNVVLPSARLTVGLPCIAGHGRVTMFPRFVYLSIKDDLGDVYTPMVDTIPCSHVRKSHLDHACKHRETCLRPVSSSRSDTLMTTLDTLINFTISSGPSP